MLKLLTTLILLATLTTLTGCGTIGGAVSGAGKDLTRAGEWVQAQMDK